MIYMKDNNSEDLSPVYFCSKKTELPAYPT